MTQRCRNMNYGHVLQVCSKFTLKSHRATVYTEETGWKIIAFEYTYWRVLLNCSPSNIMRWAIFLLDVGRASNPPQLPLHSWKGLQQSGDLAPVRFTEIGTNFGHCCRRRPRIKKRRENSPNVRRSSRSTDGTWRGWGTEFVDDRPSTASDTHEIKEKNCHFCEKTSIRRKLCWLPV